MNKILTNIRHRIGNKRYPKMGSVEVFTSQEPTAGFTDDVEHRTEIILHTRTLAPESYKQHIERDHFDTLQNLLYGDIRCIVEQIRFEATKANNTTIMTLVDELLTDIGYQR